jgi:hypothetical protein
MNHKCHGDYYEFDGARWYRCLLDSTIIDVEDEMKDDGICPRCKRVIDAADHGKVDTRELTTVQFMVDGQWHTHSICISPIKRAEMETSAEPAPGPASNRSMDPYERAVRLAEEWQKTDETRKFLVAVIDLAEQIGSFDHDTRWKP